MDNEARTYPSDAGEDNSLPNLVIEPAYRDANTDALWVHKDLLRVRDDWETEGHISPPKAAEQFGDVESWSEYVKRYSTGGVAFCTWNSGGLKAVIDYHTRDAANRCQWTAALPFVRSAEWKAWERFADGTARSQQEAIERLEDLGEDIVDPPQADLTKLLRDLRANATARADTEIRPDGTTSVSFTKDTNVSNKAGTAELPGLIKVAIPVMLGDTTRWELKVRMRVSVDASAKLTFRFTLVNAERTLETVYAERVEAAKAELGEDLVLLRAAG